MRIIIKDIITVTMNQKDEIGTYTIVIDGGRIQSLLGPRTKAALKERKDDIVISGKNRVAIPGLFNGHVHSDVTLARGLGDGLTLYEQDNDSFVSKKKWFREELDREARYYSRLLLYTEAMKCGTTYICDVPFWFYEDDLVSPLKETGLKGAVVLDYRKNFLDGEVIDKKTFFRIAQHLTRAADTAENMGRRA
jgi:5-methylthioadenosine/S-adenosylhomocysteine deaminase